MKRSLPVSLFAALCIAASAVDAAPPGAYGFCESPGAGTVAYVTPAFPLTLEDPTHGFETYLAQRYALHDPKPRCFTLSSEREATAFRLQRIEVLHWDGWQHVVATQWTPDARLTATHRADSTRTDTASG